MSCQPRLFFNADGRDGPDYGHSAFDSFVVDNGRIAARGAALDRHPEYAGLERIDLHRSVVLPAFADAHVHFMQTGLTLVGCCFDQCRSLADVFATLDAFARTHAYDWILGWNLDETQLRERRLPTIEELDAVVGPRKLWLSRIDLHSAIPSTATVRWAACQNPDWKPENGRFIKDAYNGLASRAIADLPREMKELALEKARRFCLDAGVTRVHALEGGWSASNEDVTMIAGFLSRPGFGGIVYHQSDDPGLARASGWPRLGGCLFIDGSFGSRTAALSEPYVDDPLSTGVIYRDTANIERLIRLCAEHRLQLAMHAIGDRAIASLVDAHLRHRGLFTAPVAHRIEHFELPTPDSIRRATEANLLISMQPAFEVFWGGDAGMYALRLGKRAARTNPFRTVLGAGLRIAGGSDSPVTPVDPFLGIHGFVNHPTPSERITLNEALHAFIVEPHRFADPAPERGSLAPGFHADFVCIDADPFVVPPHTLRQLRVKRTFVAGEESKPAS
ncbi:MAG TPA: amidohydrolase family protein [Candidatus Ozemobacteraceae bacterium]